MTTDAVMERNALKAEIARLKVEVKALRAARDRVRKDLADVNNKLVPVGALIETLEEHSYEVIHGASVLDAREGFGDAVVRIREIQSRSE